MSGLAVPLVAGSVAAAAVGADVGSPVSTSLRRAATEALHAWRSFPANGDPRPVIVLGSGPVSLPTNSRDATAFNTGRYVLGAHLPVVPKRHAGYALSPALAAYRELRANAMPDRESHARIRITRVDLGQATFMTDRGSQRLPAWRFFASGLRYPAAVLAVRPYRLPARPRVHLPASVLIDSAEESAQINATGTRLKISFTGGPPGTQPCDDSYAVTTFESATAVAYVIQLTAAREPVNGEACSLVGYTRSVTAHLVRPLRTRVLIDAADALPIPTARSSPKARIKR